MYGCMDGWIAMQGENSYMLPLHIHPSGNLSKAETSSPPVILKPL